MIFLIFCVPLLARVFVKAQGPYYKGKPLTSWLRGYDFGHFPSYLADDPVGRANEAVSALGTNAIPTLCVLFQTKDSPLKLKAQRWLCSSSFHNLAFKFGLTDLESHQDVCHEEATKGFEILSANAVSAVPMFIKLLEDDSISLDQRYWIVGELERMGPEAEAAVPALVHIAAAPDWDPLFDFGLVISLPPPESFRCEARRALTAIHSQPGLVVPVLISGLYTFDEQGQMEVMKLLERFGQDARAATPKVLKLIQAHKESSAANANFMRSAEHCLRKIDPETANQSGISQ